MDSKGIALLLCEGFIRYSTPGVPMGLLNTSVYSLEFGIHCPRETIRMKLPQSALMCRAQVSQNW